MRGKQKNKRSDHKSESGELFEQDENFYFIAGYTDGGFPYGITWEEYEAEQRGESTKMKVAEGDHLKELKLTKQQFQEIVDAYDMHIEEMEFYLNIETGEVVTLRTFDMDEEDEELSELIEEGFNEIYFRIPKRESVEGYADMVEFVETVEHKKLKATLMHILSGGKKVFRRFKDALSSDSEQLERYYLFIEKRNRIRIANWLESIHIKLIFE